MVRRVNGTHAFVPRQLANRAATLPASGMYKSSKTSLNGTGVWGGVTLRIGALSDPKAFSAIRAEMSVAMLHRGEASSTTTTRPVFSTLSRTVSSSNGEVVLRSMTSQSIPSFATVPRRF